MMAARSVPRLAALCAAVILWLTLATPVSAAAPWIIMIDGEAMDEPIYIADWFDNQSLLASLEPGDVGALGDRPYLDLYLFWGPDWADYVSSGKRLEDLNPEQSNQQGRFYPTYENQPAVLDLLRGHGPSVVNDNGLEVLRRYGVPVELSTVPPLPGMPDTGAGGMFHEPESTNGSIAALVFGIAVVSALTIAVVSRLSRRQTRSS